MQHTEKSEAIRNALDSTVAESLVPTSKAISLLYLVFTFGHAWLLPPPIKGIMASLAAASCFMAWWLARRLISNPPHVSNSNAIGALIAGIVFVNSFGHLFVTTELKQATNVMLMMTGMGLFFLSWKWLCIGLGVSWLSWLGLAGITQSDQEWAHYTYALFTSTFLSVLAHQVRTSTVSRIAELRWTDHQRKQELEHAMKQMAIINKTLEERNEELKMAIQNAQELADKAQAASKAKSDFLANMSHEIRTPLNGIIGMTQLLEEYSTSREQQDHLETLRVSGENLLTLVNELLDFSRVESGRMVLNQELFSLENLITDVASILAPKAFLKQVDFVLDVAPELPLEIKADPLRLRQVLVNLIGNAIKFTHSGRVTLTVTRDNSANPDFVDLFFQVLDTGIGIEEVAREKLFEPFTQADMGLTRKYGGTGLGLAISKRIIELMGGNIGFESELGKGSRFWFRLPVQQALLSQEVMGLTHTPLRGQNAWIQVKSEALALALKRALAFSNITSVRASELDLIPQNTDLLILDSRFLTEVAALQIQQSWNRNSSAKPAVLVLSIPGSNCSHWIRENALDEGPLGVLQQPVGPRQVVETLSALCAGYFYPKRQLGIEANEQGGSSPLLTTGQAKDSRITKVLLAEDNSVNVKITKIQLSKLGCEVDVVHNGIEAVDAIRRSAYDIVFMDCQMPVMDGYKATELLRASEKFPSIVGREVKRT